jgi:hypothetical protein
MAGAKNLRKVKKTFKKVRIKARKGVNVRRR